MFLSVSTKHSNLLAGEGLKGLRLNLLLMYPVCGTPTKAFIPSKANLNCSPLIYKATTTFTVFKEYHQ